MSTHIESGYYRMSQNVFANRGDSRISMQWAQEFDGLVVPSSSKFLAWIVLWYGQL